MRTTKLEIKHDKFWTRSSNSESELSTIGVSHDKGAHYTTVVGPFDLEDLKLLRKLIRKEIRRIQNENNESV